MDLRSWRVWLLHSSNRVRDGHGFSIANGSEVAGGACKARLAWLDGPNDDDAGREAGSAAKSSFVAAAMATLSSACSLHRSRATTATSNCSSMTVGRYGDGDGDGGGDCNHVNFDGMGRGFTFSFLFTMRDGEILGESTFQRCWICVLIVGDSLKARCRHFLVCFC